MWLLPSHDGDITLAKLFCQQHVSKLRLNFKRKVKVVIEGVERTATRRRVCTRLMGSCYQYSKEGGKNLKIRHLPVTSSRFISLAVFVSVYRSGPSL